MTSVWEYFQENTPGRNSTVGVESYTTFTRDPVT